MQFRFSLRVLLALSAIVAVGLYALFVRPTVIANRFMEALERQDYEQAESLCNGIKAGSLRSQISMVKKPTVNVSLRPQSRRDLWKFRRSLLIQIIPAAEAKVRLGRQSETIATNWGIEPPDFYFVTFGPLVGRE